MQVESVVLERSTGGGGGGGRACASNAPPPKIGHWDEWASPKEGKVLRVEQWLSAHQKNWQDVQITFYSDSINDLPLLQQAQIPVAVNPDTRLRQLATDRGWRILQLFS